MAFTLQVVRGSTTYTIADPFFLEGAEGMGGASVRNIEESGPYQDGATHLDERLDPRTITLKLNVIGSSAAVLDGHRDTLMEMFKPVKSVPITLKVTRDDGSVRQIDTRRTGPMDIPLVALNRPGNLHRAVVQLRAADPVWYDPTEQSEDFVVPAVSWWLAYDTIGTANVLEHVEYPSNSQLWTNAGSVAKGSAWTIVMRSGSVGPGTTGFNPIAFIADTSANGAIQFNSYFDAPGLYFFSPGNLVETFGSFMSSGTANYFFTTNGGTSYIYRDNVLLETKTGTAGPIPGTASGTAAWRGLYDDNPAKYWLSDLPNAAVYNIELNATQRSALHQAINIGSAYSLAVAYGGNFDSYPVITITGYIADPVITNTTTGDTLDFTGGTVGSGDIWTIDTRYGRKSALNAAGSSIAGYLSADSDLATFRLAPSPVATGGTNSITLSGSASGTVTAVSMSYYNRYLSF